MLVRVEGKERVERAVVADVDSDWQMTPDSERTFEVDAICLGYGLIPSVEHIARVCHDVLAGPVAEAGGRLERVTVWETEKTCCTYPASASPA